jgi:hypothetical protein
MRRSSIAVLPVVVVCVIAAWTGASVLAQPHEKNPAATVQPAYRGPLRYLARGGYLPGSATRAASGAATATRPSQVLDLRDWYLTLPTGRSGQPDTVRQPQLQSYSSPFFQLDQGRDGVVCTSNAGGVTTAHSSYPRSELREMAGDKPASWSNRSGTHTLEVRQAVTALPRAKPEVVTAQIHDVASDVIEIRLEGRRLIAQYADGKKEFVVDPAYVLGMPYDLRLVAAGGRIDIWYNGNHVGGVAQSGSGWYFKTGSYLQSNTDRGDSADAVAKVVLYAVGVTHTA